MLEMGLRMKQLREVSHLSQAEIATLCGSNQSTIARIESGQTTPTLKILIWWADFFDVSLDYLCCRTDAQQGKIYGCRPRRKISKEELSQFIELCFDPRSPVSSKVKDALYAIMEDTRK